MKIDQSTLEEIRKQTDLNDHGGALLTAANALGCETYAKSIAYINERHEHLGYLSTNLYLERQGVYDSMMIFAKESMSAEDYIKLYDAF